MDGGVTLTKPHRFTVAEYYRIAEAGLFKRDARIELIRGEIIDMAAIGSPHFGMVNRLTRMLGLAVGAQGIVHVQNPVRLGDSSEPEPDVTILKPRADDYEDGAPGPDDVLLLIEVADTSLDYDRAIKAPLYAESGIQEYWIVNVRDRIVEVYRQPVDGHHAEMRQVRTGMLDILSLPGVALSATELLRTSAAWLGTSSLG